MRHILLTLVLVACGTDPKTDIVSPFSAEAKGKSQKHGDSAAPLVAEEEAVQPAGEETTPGAPVDAVAAVEETPLSTDKADETTPVVEKTFVGPFEVSATYTTGSIPSCGLTARVGDRILWDMTMHNGAVTYDRLWLECSETGWKTYCVDGSEPNGPCPDNHLYVPTQG